MHFYIVFIFILFVLYFILFYYKYAPIRKIKKPSLLDVLPEVALRLHVFIVAFFSNASHKLTLEVGAQRLDRTVEALDAYLRLQGFLFY